jgi:putative CocE/NonD family hydrolase
MKYYLSILSIFLSIHLFAQSKMNEDSLFIRQNYDKMEYQIPMRDGIKLFTSIYVPKDASKTNKYPFLMQRTCYSVAPYGKEKYPNRLGPNRFLMREKYIFVYQDVRGRYMSEGTWTNMTPHLPNKKKKTEVDEASDTYDTIEWLIKNIPNNNGKVGQWGISYPGFYTAAGILSNHSALKASSPQAPIADFWFDDFHHNGALTLGYFLAYPVFGVQKTENTTTAWYQKQSVRPNTPDGFLFYQDLINLKNADKYYKENFFWQEVINHPNYDDFWQKRNLLPHLKNVNHAVMTVGGWFDAEDLFGPLNIYKTIEKNSKNYNTLVMGPFGHGDWTRERGKHTHNHIYFGDSLATFYQREIETPFFRHFLKEKGDGKTNLPEAYLFDTGKKEWRKFDTYPSPTTEKKTLYFHPNGKLSFEAPKNTDSYSEYVSDPKKPVPSSENIRQMLGFTPRNYMSEDQRFAASRPDVLSFQTDILTEDITIGGELMAQIFAATTGSDADFIVKLIDVYPANEPNHETTPQGIILANYHQMVRSEIMPARFRSGFEKPIAMRPNEPTSINFRLQDCLHTFKKGHRIMVQVQSTCFPLFAVNPQKFVENPYKPNDEDFIKAFIKIFHNATQSSGLRVEVFK